MSRLKNPEEINFLFFSSVFFRILSEKKSDFRPKNFKKLSKLTSVRADEHFLASNFLQKFWTFLHFLQKPLAWFSKFYLRVQSKISGRNSFFNFSLQIFCSFERNIFRLLAKKTSRNCQNYPLRVQTNNFWIEILFKSFEQFWIFCRNLWYGSQTSIFVSRVKTPEELYFLFFFSEFFFGFWAKSFSNFWPKNFKKFSKLRSKCPEEQFVAWKFFQKFWTVLDFLQKPLAGFSKFYLRVQSKNSGRNNFFILLFRVFSDFERRKFQIFGEKTSRKCQN